MKGGRNLGKYKVVEIDKQRNEYIVHGIRGKYNGLDEYIIQPFFGGTKTDELEIGDVGKVYYVKSVSYGVPVFVKDEKIKEEHKKLLSEDDESLINKMEEIVDTLENHRDLSLEDFEKVMNLKDSIIFDFGQAVNVLLKTCKAAKNDSEFFGEELLKNRLEIWKEKIRNVSLKILELEEELKSVEKYSEDVFEAYDKTIEEIYEDIESSKTK